jgi:hypothetical protein
MPANLATPATIDRKQDARATEKHDQRQARPNQQISCGPVVDSGLHRPVVGVAVGMPRALGCRSPGSPGEEGGHLPDLFLVRDQTRLEAILGGRFTEEVGIVLSDFLEGHDLLGSELKSLGLFIEAVCPPHLDIGFGGIHGAGLTQLPLRGLCGLAKIFGREVGSEIAAMAQDGAILHQAPCLEELLSSGDVIGGEEHLPTGVNDLLWLRHGRGIGAIGQDAHHEEAEQHH